MSGHSKWSTIKRQKAINDNARGKVFSKHSRAITIAVKTGGSDDPSTNYKLRVAIDAARADNMPKDTIERAISKASGDGTNLEEVTYEGFIGGGINVIVEVATDNRNRTAQEIKYILERSGGTLGGPGSVSFNFDTKGLLLVKKSGDPDAQQLSLIDAGVEEIEDGGEVFELYTDPTELYSTKHELESKGFNLTRTEIIKKPKTFIEVTDEKFARRVTDAIEQLEDNEDVQSVFDNAQIADGLILS